MESELDTRSDGYGVAMLKKYCRRYCWALACELAVDKCSIARLSVPHKHHGAMGGAVFELNTKKLHVVPRDLFIVEHDGVLGLVRVPTDLDSLARKHVDHAYESQSGDVTKSNGFIREMGRKDDMASRADALTHHLPVLGGWEVPSSNVTFATGPRGGSAGISRTRSQDKYTLMSRRRR